MISQIQVVLLIFSIITQKYRIKLTDVTEALQTELDWDFDIKRHPATGIRSLRRNEAIS